MRQLKILCFWCLVALILIFNILLFIFTPNDDGQYAGIVLMDIVIGIALFVHYLEIVDP